MDKSVDTNQDEHKPAEKPISLKPLRFEEALRALMGVERSPDDKMDTDDG